MLENNSKYAFVFRMSNDERTLLSAVCILLNERDDAALAVAASHQSEDNALIASLNDDGLALPKIRKSSGIPENPNGIAGRLRVFVQQNPGKTFTRKEICMRLCMEFPTRSIRSIGRAMDNAVEKLGIVKTAAGWKFPENQIQPMLKGIEINE